MHIEMYTKHYTIHTIHEKTSRDLKVLVITPPTRISGHFPHSGVHPKRLFFCFCLIHPAPHCTLTHSRNHSSHRQTRQEMAEDATRTRKKRAARQNSNIFAMFSQKQITEFKEAFSMIDHDNDGFLDKEDLKDMLASLGEWCIPLPCRASDLNVN